MSDVRDVVSRGAPDAEDAVRRLERIDIPANPSADELDVLRISCQVAPYLASLLSADPTRLSRVAADAYLRREKPSDVFVDELARLLVGVGDADQLDDALRSYRADEMVRLGAREIELGLADEVGRELSALADACLDAALAHHDAELRDRYGAPMFVDDDGQEREPALVVIGMGKLGGLELNFSSDIDVIYVYTSDATPSGAAVSLHEYYSKLCERVTASIGRVTDAGVVFRVDLRLRPEGRKGAIANSLPSLERYYESWGRPWERQAWLKARPCAGDEKLGAEVMDTLRPFVYPRTTSRRVVDEVTDLNRRIKAELDSTGIESGFDLKSGIGGIREIEFFAQALQLIHAGHRPALRARGTTTALDQLLFAGIITEIEHRTLTDAYRFLRRAEHVLQLHSGRQTQRVPSSADAFEVYAKRLGFSAARDLTAALASHTRPVAELFSTLGEDDDVPAPPVFSLLSGRLDATQERDALGQLGFDDLDRASHLFELARRRADSPLSRNASGAAARVAPSLLAELSTSPDPDQALGYVVDLIARRGAGSSVWRLMDQNPHVLRLIASLFGTSQYLSRQFVRHPELIDALLLAGRAHARSDVAELRAALDSRLDNADDEEQLWNRLAEFKNAEVLRVGLMDVGGALSATEVCSELTALADLCLMRALSTVTEAMTARHGVPRDESGDEVTLAVLALGKLGGQELGYASDLDLVFVYSTDGESDGDRPIANVTYMTRVAQRLMSALHAMHPGGRLYEIDTRLRPSGTKGLLVSSMSAWDRYHQGEARLWERQALIKLRPVAGDFSLGAQVADSGAEFVYGSPPAADLAATITGMRDRIERELGRGLDLKAGRGGLIDIEFAAQYLQLLHGHAHPRLRVRGTIDALQIAAELGVADTEACSFLVDAYVFLRGLEHRMRIVHDRSVHVMPDDPAELDKLARRVGLPEGAALADSYQSWTAGVRKTYERLLTPAR